MALRDLTVKIGADTSGLQKGFKTAINGIKETNQVATAASNSLASQAARLAATYRKAGMDASSSFKKAWSEIERGAKISNKGSGLFGKFNLFSGESSSGFSGLQKGLKSATSGIKSLVSTAAALVGVTASITGLYQAFKAFTSLESDVKRVNSMFGESAKYIEYFANTTAKSFGIAESSAYQFASVYGNLFKNITSDSNENAQVTIAMLKASSVVASKTGRTMEDVMERIRSGLLGNTEAIEDLGINVNVSMLEITDAFKQIADGRSWQQLTFYEQQQIRTLAILEQADKNFGDEVQKGSAFSLAVLSGAFKDLISTAGMFVNQALKPIIAWLTKITQSATYALKSLAKLMGLNLTSDTGSLTDGFSTSANSSAEISENMDDTVESAKKLKKQLAGFDELNVLSKATESNESTTVSGSPTVGTSVFSGLPALEYEEIDLDTSKLEQKLDNLKNKFQPVINALGDLWEALKPFGKTVGEGLRWLFDNVLVPFGSWTINQLIPTFFELVSESVKLLNGVLKTFQPLGNWLWNKFLKPIAKWTGGVIVSVLKGIANELKKLQKFTPALTGLVTGFVAFKGLKLLGQLKVIQNLGILIMGIKTKISLFVGMVHSFGGGLLGIIKTIKTIFAGALTAVSKFLSGLSPLMKFAGALGGAIAEFTTVYNAVYDVVTGVSTLDDSLGEIIITTGLVGTAMTALFGPVGLITTLAVGAAGAIAGVTKAHKDMAEEISKKAFYDAVGTPINEVSGAFSAFADTIINRNQDILIMRDTLDTNRVATEDSITAYSNLKEQLYYTGDESLESANKMGEAADIMANAARTQMQGETTAAISVLKQAWSDLGTESDAATETTISNMYLASAKYDRILADLQQNIDSLEYELSELDETSEEYASKKLEFDAKLEEMESYIVKTSDATDETDLLLHKLDTLGNSKIDFMNETTTKQALEDISTYYDKALQSIDEATVAGVSSIDELYLKYKTMQDNGETLDFDLSEWYNDSLNDVREGFQKQRENITLEVDKTMEHIGTSLDTQISNSLIDVKESLREETRQNLYGGLIAGFNDSLSDIKSKAEINGMGEYVVAGFCDGIDKNIDQVKDSTKRMSEETITTCADVLDINSPSKEMKKLGGFVPMGFAEGVRNKISVVTAQMKTLCSQVIATTKTGLQTFPKVFSGIFTQILENTKNFINDKVKIIKNGLSNLSNEISGIQNPFENYFTNTTNNARDFATNIIDVIQSIKNSMGDVFYGIIVDSWNFGEDLNYNLKNALNTMISTFNVAFKSLNALNGALSSIPGYSMSFNIPEIPYLAKGGVVTKPTRAVIGEDGAEAVMPLENNTGWIDKLAMKINNAQGNNTSNNAKVDVYLYPNSKAYQRDILNTIKQEKARGGSI